MWENTFPICWCASQVAKLNFCIVLERSTTGAPCDGSGGGGSVSVVALIHGLHLCTSTAEWDASPEPSSWHQWGFFSLSSVVVNRSQAGAGGPLSATGAAAVPVERHGAAASALDRWTGWDVPAHLHPTRDRRRAAEARVSGKKNRVKSHLLLLLLFLF